MRLGGRRKPFARHGRLRRLSKKCRGRKKPFEMRRRHKAPSRRCSRRKRLSRRCGGLRKPYKESRRLKRLFGRRRRHKAPSRRCSRRKRLSRRCGGHGSKLRQFEANILDAPLNLRRLREVSAHYQLSNARKLVVQPTVFHATLKKQ